jgi:hypothetical protein
MAIASAGCVDGSCIINLVFGWSRLPTTRKQGFPDLEILAENRGLTVGCKKSLICSDRQLAGPLWQRSMA